MKIKYEVEIGETFTPPTPGLAPSNYDPAKHNVILYTGEVASDPVWSSVGKYRLELKKVETRFFTAFNEVGRVSSHASLESAWGHVWIVNHTPTKFVMEYVYENDMLIDIIVHKDPKG